MLNSLFAYRLCLRQSDGFITRCYRIDIFMSGGSTIIESRLASTLLLNPIILEHTANPATNFIYQVLFTVTYCRHTYQNVLAIECSNKERTYRQPDAVLIRTLFLCFVPVSVWGH